MRWPSRGARPTPPVSISELQHQQACQATGRQTGQLHSMTILPHWPDRAAAKAPSHCSAGKRWVMTEREDSRGAGEVASIALIAYQVSSCA